MVVKEHSNSQKETQSAVFGEGVRLRLFRSFDREPIALPLKIGSIEDLVVSAKEAVNMRWKSEVASEFHKEVTSWIPHIKKDARSLHCLEVLSDPDLLETKMSIRQLSDLDVMRTHYPQGWYSLVYASMERQNAEVEVLSRWSHALSPQTFDHLGMTKDGFFLAIEIAQTTGPLVNETFLRQMQLADLPFGSEETPGKSILGAEHVYEIKQPDGSYKLLPYREMFPKTWPKLVDALEKLSEKTEQLVREQKVPVEYIALSVYLKKLEEAYGSRETNFAALHTLWQGLEDATHTYLLSGCPITLSKQDYAYVTGASGKVDAELRVALETPKTKAYEYMLMPYQRVAKRLASRYDSELSKPSSDVKVRFQEMLFGTGSNAFWRTQGESNEKTIDIYVDSGEQVARYMVLPIYERIFGKQLDTRSKDIFIRNYVESLAVHELGHTVLSCSDDAVITRIGSGVGLNAVEELKADLVGMKIFWEHIKDTWDMDHAKRMLEILVSYSLEYMLNRQSADGHGTSMYGDGGAVILSHLLNSGALAKNNNGVYEITDVTRGFSSLVGVAEYICAMYADPTTTPERIEAYAKYLKKHSENAKLQELLLFARK